MTTISFQRIVPSALHSRALDTYVTSARYFIGWPHTRFAAMDVYMSSRLFEDTAIDLAKYIRTHADEEVRAFVAEADAQYMRKHRAYKQRAGGGRK